VREVRDRGLGDEQGEGGKGGGIGRLGKVGGRRAGEEGVEGCVVRKGDVEEGKLVEGLGRGWERVRWEGKVVAGLG